MIRGRKGDSRLAIVSISRQPGAIMRQQTTAWEALGMSRATWYRHGKPTKPLAVKSVHETAKFVGSTSTRSYQRMMRVLTSDLAGYFHAGQLSIAKIDRILSNPAAMRLFNDMAAKAEAEAEAESKEPV